MTCGVAAGIGPEEAVAYGAAVQGDLLSAESQFEETLGEMWSDATVLEVRNTHRQECRPGNEKSKQAQARILSKLRSQFASRNLWEISPV